MQHNEWESDKLLKKDGLLSLEPLASQHTLWLLPVCRCCVATTVGLTWGITMLQDVVGGGWRNKLAYMGLSDLQMPIIHTWNVSLNMWKLPHQLQVCFSFLPHASSAPYACTNACTDLI